MSNWGFEEVKAELGETNYETQKSQIDKNMET